ncbi:hypothetical protein KKA15_03480 [Patescibacteria group bacterium]|nr:hypothetical protein [Patescibacteria group bacterium]
MRDQDEKKKAPHVVLMEKLENEISVIEQISIEGGPKLTLKTLGYQRMELATLAVCDHCDTMVKMEIPNEALEGIRETTLELSDRIPKIKYCCDVIMTKIHIAIDNLNVDILERRKK